MACQTLVGFSINTASQLKCSTPAKPLVTMQRTACRSEQSMRHPMPEAKTGAGMGSRVNSTGLPPSLLFKLTTSSVTDVLSPRLTDLGIAILS